MSVTQLLALFPIVTAMASLVGYFIKRRFDLRMVRHQLFQKSKITAIENFFSAYTSLEVSWRLLPNSVTDSPTPDQDKLVDLYEKPFNEFKSSYHILLMYLTEEEMNPFVDFDTRLQILYKRVGKFVYFRPQYNEAIINGLRTDIKDAFDTSLPNLIALGKKTQVVFHNAK